MVSWAYLKASRSPLHLPIHLLVYWHRPRLCGMPGTEPGCSEVVMGEVGPRLYHQRLMFSGERIRRIQKGVDRL